MNLGEIRGLVRFYLNETSGEGFYKNVDLDRLINQAIRKVNAELARHAPDLFTIAQTFPTQAGVKSYALPEDFRRLRRLEHAPSEEEITKLEGLPFPDTERGHEWPFDGRGKPRRFVLRAKQYDLLPIPDGVYTLRLYYDQLQPDLSEDDEVPTTPEEWHDMIALWAAILALPANADSYLELLALYRERQGDLVTALFDRKGTTPLVVQGYLEGV